MSAGRLRARRRQRRDEPPVCVASLSVQIDTAPAPTAESRARDEALLQAIAAEQAAEQSAEQPGRDFSEHVAGPSVDQFVEPFVEPAAELGGASELRPIPSLGRPTRRTRLQRYVTVALLALVGLGLYAWRSAQSETTDAPAAAVEIGAGESQTVQSRNVQTQTGQSQAE